MPFVEATNACKACSKKYSTPIEAGACCLWAPEPSGWCAWCGVDVKSNAVFCSHPCSVSFHEEEDLVA